MGRDKATPPRPSAPQGACPQRDDGEHMGRTDPPNMAPALLHPPQHPGSARPSSRQPQRGASRLSPHSGKMAQPPVLLKDMKLLDVKLGQLPSWLAMRDFTPGGILGAIRRGYNRYYNKYIDVRKGGLGGISMVLAGYVVISYIWSYSHLKHERRRKYH